MSDGMTKEQYTKRVQECAALLRKISDSKVLGDGTRESWACGISAGLLEDLLEYLEQYESMARTVDEASELIRRLQGRIKRLVAYDEQRDIVLHARLISETRADTVRKLSEMLKANAYTESSITGYRHSVIDVEEIDRIEKEILGGLE